MDFTRRRFLSLAAAELATRFHRGVAFAAAPPFAARQLLKSNLDWTSFLARHDMIWDRMPVSWGEAPFFGNGHFALYFHAEPGGDAIKFGIDHTDVFDRRDASWGTVSYSRSRYHVGDFLLTPRGKVLRTNLRLRLQDASLAGVIETSAGILRLRVYVHALRDVAVVELTTEGGEDACRWTWRPGDPSSSRPPVRNAQQQKQYEQLYGHPVKIWVPNPQGEQTAEPGANVYFQRLLAGGGYATAWKEWTTGNRRSLVISTAMRWPEMDAPAVAVENVRRTINGSSSSDEVAHRDWWRGYYEKSFLSIPDGKLESFYWIQIYKYGCAAPKDIGIIDTHGPWLQPTSWPYITWNLNTQISYWALQPSNRLELSESLFRALDRGKNALRENVRPLAFQSDSAALGHCSQQDLVAPLDGDARYQREWGNLLWICHNYWLQYRFTMDEGELRGRLYPLLRRAVNFYLHSIERGSDGLLHLPETYSPETSTTRDCNYDLALLRWACGALVESAGKLGVEDPGLPRWKEVTQRLAPYPTDEHGYRVGADLTAQAHRHFSHLLMIYPLHLVTWDDEEQRPLIRKSVDYWLSSSASSSAQTGFTLAVGASMQATMLDGNRALQLLEQLLDAGDGKHKIMPNTMYAESGQNIESPLAAAQAIHDMLLQSWGGVLRVFSAVPSNWQCAAFHNLRTEGAFLVSARRSEGKTVWIRVRSLAGEPCRVRCDLPDEVEAISAGGRQTLRKNPEGLLAIALQRDEEVLLRAAGADAPAVVEACPLPPDQQNSFGVHAPLLPVMND